jgi:hypothetical protein
VRVERRDGAWLLVGPLVPPGAGAMTLGRLILIRPARRDDELLVRHELVHVRQWRDLGVFGFLRRYLASYAAWRLRGYGHWPAYRRIPLEIQADWAARRSL